MNVPRLRSRHSRKRTGLLVGIGLAALTVGGAGAYFVTHRPTSAPQSIATSAQTVAVATAQTARISRTIEAAGTVAARDLLPRR